MALFSSLTLRDRVKQATAAIPSSVVPKGLYAFNVLEVQNGRDHRDDKYIRFELTPTRDFDTPNGITPPPEKTYILPKLFRLATGERPENEMADFVAFGNAIGFTTAQLASEEFTAENLIGGRGFVGVEIMQGKTGPFSVTAFGAWFRMDAEHIDWEPRGADADGPSQDEQIEHFRNSGKRHADESRRGGNRR